MYMYGDKDQSKAHIKTGAKTGTKINTKNNAKTHVEAGAASKPCTKKNTGKDSVSASEKKTAGAILDSLLSAGFGKIVWVRIDTLLRLVRGCLLYTSDAADE